MDTQELGRDQYLALDLEIQGLQTQNDLWHMEIDQTHARLDGLHQAEAEYEAQIEEEERIKREEDERQWHIDYDEARDNYEEFERNFNERRDDLHHAEDELQWMSGPEEEE